MIRELSILSSGALLLLAVAGCANKGSKDSTTTAGDSMQMSQPTNTSSAAVYTCTMHPDVVTSQPGKCPKCGMSLVAKK